jgi:hypothetical protein
MRLTILALSFAGLCVPGIALAQGTTAEVMRTTPGARCTGDIVASHCTLTDPQYAAGNLGSMTGTLNNRVPVTTGTTGTTGGSGGAVSPTTPYGSMGTGGGTGTGGAGMGGASSGGSSSGY